MSLSLLAGCASDALSPPEPELGTPGTFVAVRGYDAEGEIALLRVLDRLLIDKDRLLFMTVYDVRPESFEEAREMAKSHDIPIRLLIRVEPDFAVLNDDHRIVWFRSLTEEEEARVP